jgi:hypothetical protein
MHVLFGHVGEKLVKRIAARLNGCQDNLTTLDGKINLATFSCVDLLCYLRGEAQRDTVVPFRELKHHSGFPPLPEAICAYNTLRRKPFRAVFA